MLGATDVAIFFIPLFYVALEKVGEKLTRRRQPPPAAQAAEPVAGAHAP
jgi:hypothetical protein